ncbi:hypothetical protein Purlil1_3842 [Purpureocillium lilacinum]|uniref:Uncharacterized protein n=2 Tax=Purpureocillium lilacinum TaxID=33203 RepID=A0ABR0C7R0_PURLI|nr:hypothetical protein Purlil1_3842 [Purpureocillium lilacinum]
MPQHRTGEPLILQAALLRASRCRRSHLGIKAHSALLPPQALTLKHFTSAVLFASNGPRPPVMRVRKRNGPARLTTKRPRQVAGSLPGAEDAARPPSCLVQLERERACDLDKHRKKESPLSNQLIIIIALPARARGQSPQPPEICAAPADCQAAGSCTTACTKLDSVDPGCHACQASLWPSTHWKLAGPCARARCVRDSIRV